MTTKEWLKRWGLVSACFLLGSVLLLLAAWPFLRYVILKNDRKQSRLVAPVPDSQFNSQVITHDPQVISDVSVLQNQPIPEMIDESLYYMDLKHWFNDDSQLSFNRLDKQYILDIPKLKISNALVKVGGTDLDNNLIHYATAPFPGERGASIIFGHSVLRQFYDPRENNSRRYMSIFSTIMTLTAGDKIHITSDGVRYTYEVLHSKNVKPDDAYILEQDDSDRFLKLVTCTPEGTYLMRGVVTAKLVYE